MTGAGAGDLAWLHEPVDDYAGTPTDDDYKPAGKDVTIDNLSIENALQQLRNFSAEAVDQVATTFEGALSISGTLTPGTMWLLNHVYGSPPSQSGSGPYTYEWAPDTQRAQSARFYVGLDYLNGFAERTLKGSSSPSSRSPTRSGRRRRSRRRRSTPTRSSPRARRRDRSRRSATRSCSTAATSPTVATAWSRCRRRRCRSRRTLGPARVGAQARRRRPGRHQLHALAVEDRHHDRSADRRLRQQFGAGDEPERALVDDGHAGPEQQQRRPGSRLRGRQDGVLRLGEHRQRWRGQNRDARTQPDRGPAGVHH